MFTVLIDTPSGLPGERRYGPQAVTVADPVRVRRLDDQEGQQLVRIIHLRRAMVAPAWAGGNTVPAITEFTGR
jgi:hypothetical protein